MQPMPPPQVERMGRNSGRKQYRRIHTVIAGSWIFMCFKKISRPTLRNDVTPAGVLLSLRTRLPIQVLACIAILCHAGMGHAETPLFARVELERPSLFVQESFPVTISLLYRDMELGRQVQLEGLPRDGFEWSTFQELAATRMRLRDHVYQVRRFRGRARALAPGRYRLAPTLHVNELVRDRSQWRGEQGRSTFFSESVRHESRVVSVEAAALEIKPLPDAGRPADFSGAVGRFTFTAEVDRAEAAVGEPVALRMTIIGEGNPDLVRAPALPSDDAFRVHEPRLIERDFDSARGIGKKVFEAVLVPRVPGHLKIPALSFSYFDPADAAYQTVQRGPFPLRIPAGSPEPALPTPPVRDPASPHPAEIGTELRYLKPAPPRRDWTLYESATRSPGRTAVDVVPVLIGGLLVFAGRRRAQRENDPVLARRIHAERTARRALIAARSAAESGESALFFDALGTALAARYGSRFHLPPGEITAHRVQDAGANEGLDPKICEALHDLLTRVDAGRFGGMKGTKGEMLRLLDTARELERSIERTPKNRRTRTGSNDT